MKLKITIFLKWSAVILLILNIHTARFSWASSAFDLSIDGQNLNVNTSKRLHYGIISKDDFIRADFDALFTNTTMINRQETFFDISQLGSGSLTQTPTSIEFSTLGYNGPEKEFLLYTEFDRFSKPSVLNYATVGSLIISATSSTTTGKKVADSVKNLLDGIEKISETATTTLEVTRTCNETLIGIFDLAGVPANHELRRVPNSVQNAISRVDSVLGQFNSVLVSAQKTPSRPINDIYTEMQGYTGFQGGKTGANALYHHLLRLFTDDISKTDDHLKSIMASRTLQATIVEVMVETMLEPFSYDGNFYYPKNGNFITPYSNITNPNDYEPIEVSQLARNITRYLKGDKLGDFPNSTNQVAAKRQIVLASKAIFAAGGKKMIERVEKVFKDLESTEKAVQIAQTLVNKALNVSTADLFNFAKMLVETAAESVPDIGTAILKQVAIRITSYAVPASGWVKAAVDLGDLANTGGAFAYDVLTAPRQVPFVIADQNGTTVVYQPFAMNLKKYSYLRYPTGNAINTLDPFSNGQYPFDSYFLNGNAPSGSFTPWNVNNRDATLVASGAVYSYDMILGAGNTMAGCADLEESVLYSKENECSGYLAFKSLFDNSGDFAGGFYNVNFDVLTYPNDNTANQPTTFTSPLTGVTNSENQNINENYLLGGIGLNLFNITDYRARHYNSYSLELHNYTGSDSTLLSYDSIVSDTAQGQYFNDLYYLSFKDNFVAELQNKYGSTFSSNYNANKGIMHATPGIFLLKTGLGIRAPLNTKATHPTTFEDKQLMFVMASTSNASSSQLYKDPQYIPFIGIPNGAGISNRTFEYDQSRDGYNFVFSLKENNFKRKIRIVLFNKDESDNFSDFSFYTLDPSVDYPDANGLYRIPVPDIYFNSDLNGNRYTKGSLRVAWYDGVASEYCKYSGTNESDLLKDMFFKNRAASQNGATDDAVRKVFMVQYLFGNMTALAASAANGTIVSVVGTDTPAVDPNDSDDDGLPDAWEMLYFGNLNQGPYDDPDGDGVNNLLEYRNGTDPTKPGISGIIQNVIYEPYTVTLNGTSWTVDTFSPSGDIYANVYFNGGTIDLKGETLTIYGDLIHTGGNLVVNNGNLIVKGDYRIQRPIKDAQGNTTGWTSSGGVLTMTNPNDHVLVEKGFYYDTSGTGYTGFQGGYCTASNALPTNMSAGTLEIKGNFEQKATASYNCYSSYYGFERNFYPIGTHRVKFSGTAKQTVSFQTPRIDYSRFNILELANNSTEGVVFNTDFNVLNLLSNNKKLNPLTINAMSFTLGNNEVIAGDLVLKGSTLDLNGKSLTVEGNLIHSGGTLNVNGGNLFVKGDYRIQTPVKDGQGNITSWTYSGGVLNMTNPKDYVLVEKGFYYDTSGTGYTGFQGGYCTASNALPTNMSAGILEIKGNFEQKATASYSCYTSYYGFERNFYPIGTHRVKFSGTTKQTVSFQTPRIDYSRFNILELANNSTEGVVFNTDFNVLNLLSNNNKLNPLTINAMSFTLGNNEVVAGDLVLNGSTLDLNGKSLTIEGNLVHGGGTLNVNGGNLIVKGDYRIQRPVKDAQGNITSWNYSGGVLNMINPNDYVLVWKNFYIDTNGTGYTGSGGDNSPPTNLSAGTLEIKGNFEQKATAYYNYYSMYFGYERDFYASGTHRVKLSGTTKQTVSFQTPRVDFSRFNILELANSSPEGVDFITTVIIVGEIRANAPVITHSDNVHLSGTAQINGSWNQDIRLDQASGNLTLQADQTIRNFYVDASTLDLNGKQLTVTGDLIHTGGNLVVNNGRLIVNGDYRIQSPIKDVQGNITGWAYSSGVLTMINPNDYVLVGKDFYIDTNGTGYTGYGGSNAIPTNMLAGTLEIKGNFNQKATAYYNYYSTYYGYERNFYASGTHRVKFSGTAKQTVSFQTPRVDFSRFNVLELANSSPEGVVFNTDFNVLNLVSNNQKLNPLTINAMSFTLSNNEVVAGDLVLNGNTLDLNGKVLTVEGNLIHGGGTLNVNGGNLIVKGDYRIQTPVKDSQGNITSWTYGGGVLTMTNAIDYVKVFGSFYIDTYGVGYESASAPTNMTEGVLEIKGDFQQKSNAYYNSYGTYYYYKKNFFASGNHKVLLSGASKQSVSFSYPGADWSHFNILETTNQSTEGIVFTTQIAVTKLFNHHKNKFTLQVAGSQFPDYDGDGISDNYDQDPTDPAIVAFNYPLVISTTGTGQGSVLCGAAACSTIYSAGTTISLTAQAMPGSKFSGWSGACSGTGPCNLLMDSDKTVSAQFDIIPVNGVCGSSNGKTYTTAPITNLCSSGAPSEVSALDPVAFTWSWSCNAVGTGTTSSCYANIQTYSLAVTLSGTGSGTITSYPQGAKPTGISCTSGICTTTFAYNESVSLLQTPNNISVFDSWGGDCSAKSDCGFIMNGPKAVTAIFSLAPKAKIGDNGYPSLTAAISVAKTGDMISLIDSELPDNGLDINSALGNGKLVILKGGYKADYSGTSGLPTFLKGRLNISSGRISIEGVKIR